MAHLLMQASRELDPEPDIPWEHGKQVEAALDAYTERLRAFLVVWQESDNAGLESMIRLSLMDLHETMVDLGELRYAIRTEVALGVPNRARLVNITLTAQSDIWRLTDRNDLRTLVEGVDYEVVHATLSVQDPDISTDAIDHPENNQDRADFALRAIYKQIWLDLTFRVTPAEG